MHIKNHFLILLFLAPLSLFAQKVERGLSYLDKNEKQYIQWLIDIGQIISPSGQEQERAEAVAAIMREIGLQEVRVNEMPNAIGIIPGKSNKSIVFISTLDDLAGVAEHQRKAEGPPYYAGGRIIGPGTNTSSTSVSILAAAQALIESNIQPEHNLVFAAVAQEETGLKGMKHLFEEFKDEAVIFVDVLGDGHRISYGALGIHWWKVVASGPPGAYLERRPAGYAQCQSGHWPCR
jgi:acetylornithine deacetylase/succinyl-diaminopimelate desuccinylase-like protein